MDGVGVAGWNRLPSPNILLLYSTWEMHWDHQIQDYANPSQCPGIVKDTSVAFLPNRPDDQRDNAIQGLPLTMWHFISCRRPPGNKGGADGRSDGRRTSPPQDPRPDAVRTWATSQEVIDMFMTRGAKNTSRVVGYTSASQPISRPYPSANCKTNEDLAAYWDVNWLNRTLLIFIDSRLYIQIQGTPPKGVDGREKEGMCPF